MVLNSIDFLMIIAVIISYIQYVLFTFILDLTKCLVQVINYNKKYKYLL